MPKLTNKQRLGIQEIWNNSVRLRPERELVERDRLWASELGASPIEVYYKAKGIEPSNPFNERSLRKFEAGNFWEWAVGMVLKRTGILNSSQEWLQYHYPDLMPVTGRLDFFIGGKVDWEKAKKDVVELNAMWELPDFMARFAETIVDEFSKKYPEGIEPAIVELKSASSFMFDEYEKTGAEPKHVLQCFHYMMAKDMKVGYVTYLCKDDVRMLEFKVNRTPAMEKWYHDKIALLTNYIRNDIVPPKEQEIIFDAQRGKFKANWKVAYSSYLTKIYGYKDQAEFDDANKSKVARWNRVIARVVKGDNMTDMNLQVIEEIKFAFSNYDKLIEVAKKVYEKGGVIEDDQE